MAFWKESFTPAAFEQLQNGRVKKAKTLIKQMLSASGRRTFENTLVPYDRALMFLNSAGSQGSLIQEVHPDKDFRATAEKVVQDVSAYGNELSLNRDVYEAIAAIETKDADETTKFYVEKILRNFRLAGVDKDDATRQKVRELMDELVLIGQEFSANIRDDNRKVMVEDVKELDGLPQDFIDSHKAGKDGKIALTTDYVDFVPVMTYAKSDDLRRRMYLAFNNRAFPQNSEVLKKMTGKRFELASLLGFKSWADYVTADKMIKTSGNASDFIGKIVDLSGERAKREYQELLKRKREDDPHATAVNRWEVNYYSDLVRKENYAFDSQSVRPYLSYQRVKQGVLDVTAKLFGVRFIQVKNAAVWHPLVECWEMFDKGKLAGRFYLDMHPREGKYSHAAQFDIKTGVAGRQLPEACLVCNFPGGQKGESDLMEHNDVVTFFHEFGHLLHSLFAGKQKWAGVGGISTEWDFVEAPSQMLEEWARDPKALQSFARHHETGEPIPAELVTQMNRAGEFGKGLQVRRQMVFARVSLSAYDRSPESVDLDRLVPQIEREYLPFPSVEGTHFQTAFGHLDGYSAIYYTYMWSLVIAKDMFSKFERTNLFAPEIARKYRRAVLEKGGSEPADKLVESFLDRKYDFAAYQKWLDQDAN
jgi:thimet oligopeptidase